MQVRPISPGVTHVLAGGGGVRPEGAETVTADRQSVVSEIRRQLKVESGESNQ